MHGFLERNLGTLPDVGRAHLLRDHSRSRVKPPRWRYPRCNSAGIDGRRCSMPGETGFPTAIVDFRDRRNEEFKVAELLRTHALFLTRNVLLNLYVTSVPIPAYDYLSRRSTERAFRLAYDGALVSVNERLRPVGRRFRRNHQQGCPVLIRPQRNAFEVLIIADGWDPGEGWERVGPTLMLSDDPVRLFDTLFRALMDRWSPVGDLLNDYLAGTFDDADRSRVEGVLHRKQLHRSYGLARVLAHRDDPKGHFRCPTPMLHDNRAPPPDSAATAGPDGMVKVHSDGDVAFQVNRAGADMSVRRLKEHADHGVPRSILYRAVVSSNHLRYARSLGLLPPKLEPPPGMLDPMGIAAAYRRKHRRPPG